MTMHVPSFNQARVLVVGDVMLDRYWQGEATRISPEAPVPVVRVRHSEARPGGAANVALNAAALGARVTLLGVTGADEEADLLVQQLQAASVECVFERVAGLKTITKLRVLSHHQQLIRLDFDEAVQGMATPDLLRTFSERLAGADAVILSDYGKGALNEAQVLIKQARALGKPVLVDPKGRDFTKYRGATLITPNLAEFEAVAGHCQNDRELERRGERLRRDLDLDALLVTRGEHGMSLLRAGLETLHLPAHAREVYDVTGAGDTVIAMLGAALAAGAELADAARLANLAAGIVVGKLGAATVSVAELQGALHEAQPVTQGVLSEPQLLDAVAQARARGAKVVMTNGCFDILHAGHVSYLEQARKLGDCLIVAVNDDASVARLKDNGAAARPINPLAQRMQVLAALKCVDWVAPFSEDTPQRLICRVLPDILVKGGDYRPEQIAGHECVIAHGGEVRILPYIPGQSTTRIIEMLRADQASQNA
ncbi:MAG: bifunctional D-glycero-beta-D-manno-heptose-7-phosphate kinase/D-glycero-beta-D-manno-heptose 1-phosphate adenylyltransferase HldE [Gammaproteobacteria bacterium]|nr:MAG: bifunctional D-glycero-beta-D-manno-heptose-7-phosphate kinase/D-glycero-beta-D-manno-heptose 1-phosphate adenylyltransferase HldE [Gammaproteobacteria bacterium]